MGDCKVCNHPRATEIMQKVFAGEMNYTDAAKEFNIPVPTVWNCFKEHWQQEITDKGVALTLKDVKNPDDFVTVLKGFIAKLIKQVDDAMGQPANTYNATAVTKLSKELREMMRDILEFEGKLKTGPLVQLNVLQTQFTKLTSVIFSEMCSECQAKLLKVLPELTETQPPTITA
ncbi:MAG: hypothetical protein AM326_03105 [Candidatus Thorarchaeota archaeon SMTZ-45]|nr:MAG: hypothetical protein AM326_03105 [Candidatus Thorarchaeota archaeon SMTZ-45]